MLHICRIWVLLLGIRKSTLPILTLYPGKEFLIRIICTPIQSGQLMCSARLPALYLTTHIFPSSMIAMEAVKIGPEAPATKVGAL